MISMYFLQFRQVLRSEGRRGRDGIAGRTSSGWKGITSPDGSVLVNALKIRLTQDPPKS
jgi:hypothetical protein